MNRRILLAAALGFALLGGCFDSLVSDPCLPGFALTAGSCVPTGRVDPDAGPIVDAPDGGPADGQLADGRRGDAGADASIDGSTVVVDASLVDAAPPADALVCTLPLVVCGSNCIDVSADPDNCGACGRVCASGICSMSACVGAVAGHAVVIGHDYAQYHAGVAGVLGNAVSLGVTANVPVSFYRGTATAAATTGAKAALTSTLAGRRAWHEVALVGEPTVAALAKIDVLVVLAQTGDGAAAEAAGARWASMLATFSARGGVVVFLEGASGVSYRVAKGAGLFDVSPPVTITGQQVHLINAGDPLATGVPSPYLAEPTSVGFPGVAGAVVGDQSGEAVVFHN
jgi:hypothetical protein